MTTLHFCIRNKSLSAFFRSLLIFSLFGAMLSACSLGDDNLNRNPKAYAADLRIYFDPAAIDTSITAELNSASYDYDGSIVSQIWDLKKVVSLTTLNSANQAIPANMNSRQLLNATILTRPSQKKLTVEAPAQAAVYYFTLHVTDNQNAQDNGQVKLEVLPRGTDISDFNAQWNETSPALSAGPHLRVNSKDRVSLSAWPFNLSGNVSYTWQLLDDAGLNFSLPQSTGQSIQFIAPDSISSRSLSLRVTASNGSSQYSATQSLDIIASQGLQIAPIADQTVQANQKVYLTANINGAVSSVKWSQSAGTPSVTLNNSNTASANFDAPLLDTQSVLQFKVEARDGQNNLAQAFTNVTVLAQNNGGNPGSPSVSAGADQSVTSGDVVNLQGSASSGNGGIKTILWRWLAGANITINNANTLQASFSAPQVSQASSVSVQLEVTYNDGSVANDVAIITINPPNQPPSVFAGNDKVVASGSSVSLTAQANDSDGFITQYQWSWVSGPIITFKNGAQQAQVSFDVPLVSVNTDLVLKVAVKDDRGASAEDQIVLTITPGNVPPQAVIVAPTKANQGDPILLDGSQSSDSDGNITNYQWTATSSTLTITLTGQNSPNASFTVQSVTQPTSVQVQLTVTDDSNASSSASHTLTVYPLSTLSGTISAANANFVDGDINQIGPGITTVSNDSIASAQHLSNPFMLGGYVNEPGTGPAGRSQTSGDLDDYYYVTLNAGQSVSLAVTNAQANVNEVGLLLLEETAPNNVVDVSLSGLATQTVSATSAGNYFIRVVAQVGASAYLLSSSNSTPLQSNGWSLRDNFVVDDIIAKKSARISSANFGRAITRVGIAAKTFGVNRRQLFKLATTASSSAGRLQSLRAADPRLQAKLDTLIKAEQLRHDSAFESVSLNYLLQASAVPSDSLYTRQWDLPLINLPLAWDTSFGSNNVIVAVIDTGILPNHPDIVGQLVPGYDFIRSATRANDGNGIDSDPTDTGNGIANQRSSFHGTHVAGTIAAATNNGSGVAGVAGGVRIMPLRVIGVDGGTSYDVEQAIRYAAGLANDSNTLPAQKADVINLSLGGPGTSTTPPSAYREARAAGVIIIAAAGNDGSNALTTPAGYDGVVSVSAVTISRSLAGYSNFGPTVDVAAPGGSSGDINNDGFPDSILSLGANDLGPSLVYEYNYKMGTSMASPHVAGVAALMKSVFPDLTPAMFDTLLANGDLTQDLGTPGRDDSFGYGLIDASRAVSAALAAGGGSTTPPNPAILSVSPTALGFGASLNTLTFSISNAGGNTLIVNSVTPTVSWLQVSPLTVDANNVGSYNVSVNRSALADNIYSASIVINTNVGSLNLDVSMQVISLLANTDAGPQVVELINNLTGQRADMLILNAINGQYTYTFPSVALGEYRIQSSSDLDNDGLLCELGESCGAYPLLGSTISSNIVVDGINTDLINLDFPTGFDPNLPLK